MAEQPLSYDDDLHADTLAAFKEHAAEEPVITEKVSEPEVKTHEEKPTEKPVEAKTDDRPRDEHGRFVPKTETKTEEKPAEVKAPVLETKPETKPEEKPAEVKPTEQPVTSAPPPGWSIKSKSEWDKLPEHIRADIAKREQEVSQGFAQYQGLKPVLKYAEMARQRGTTLEASLERYVGIENLLSQDLLKGILHIAGNAGIQPQQLAQALAPYAGQAPQPATTEPGQFDPSALQPYLNPVLQKVQTIEHQFTQWQQEQSQRQMAAINTALDKFKSDPAHRYYDNLEPQIIKLFEGGMVARTGDYMADLKTAYELACRLDPEISDLQIKERIAKTESERIKAERDAAEKAKLASRSITGSPGDGRPAPSNGGSIEDDVRQAFRLHSAAA